jgi:hypothetical protein
MGYRPALAETQALFVQVAPAPASQLRGHRGERARGLGVSERGAMSTLFAATHPERHSR